MQNLAIQQHTLQHVEHTFRLPKLEVATKNYWGHKSFNICDTKILSRRQKRIGANGNSSEN